MDMFIAIFACGVIFIIIWGLSESRKYPPGPWGLPILGYIPFLSEKPYLKLEILAKKYGKIFSICLGSQNVVVLNDFETIKTAFAQDVFIGRPPEFSFELNDITKKTGAFLGLGWKEQRRVSLHALRDLGFGKTMMETHIQEEIEEILEHFEKNVRKPFCVRTLLASSMSNNIGALMFGRRFEYSDPTRQMLTRTVNESTMAAVQVSWTLFFPWLKKILRLLRIGNTKRVSKAVQEFSNFIKQEIDEHERTLNREKMRDFIDKYLLEMQKRKEDAAFHKDVLEDLVGAFFTAGSETVRLSVEWLIIAMAHYQSAQLRIKAEIDEIIGKDRAPIWSDHKNMPYTVAFMMEMQRWKTVAPLNIMRYTLADTELYEYTIPKHTQVIANLWAVHHDKDYWGDNANEFQPERFLEEDGKTVKKWEHFIPFSIGKRACPGEPLAKIEIFLYFTSILQKFHIQFPVGKVANFDADLGVALMPKAQEVVLTKEDDLKNKLPTY